MIHWLLELVMRTSKYLPKQVLKSQYGVLSEQSNFDWKNFRPIRALFWHTKCQPLIFNLHSRNSKEQVTAH
ncbi:hypothetical protein BDZ91DRAFT_711843 [Kalaharituber pfeilii]|nr:hypothetical protein BDZ91DRAFT_711843 [Kalaharituber pfeilii]